MKKSYQNSSTVYACKPATDDELISAINKSEYKQLHRITIKSSFNKIRWSSIHTLCVIGWLDSTCNTALKDAGFKPGMYVNRSGDWLFLIHLQPSQIQTLLNLTKKRLKSLRILNASLTALDLTLLTAVEQLDISRNTDLSEIKGLEHLSNLTDLSLRDCGLERLPNLDNLTQLRTLNLCGCVKLIQLPSLDHQEQLTTLNLARCRSLTQLPSLDSLTQLTTLNLSYCDSPVNEPDRMTQLNSIVMHDRAGHLYSELDLTSHLRQEYRNMITYAMLLHDIGHTTSHSSLSRTMLARKYLTRKDSPIDQGCAGISQLPSLDNLTKLISLHLAGCQNLTRLPPLNNHKHLARLDLSDCSSLTQLPELNHLNGLIKLNLANCSSLTRLPPVDNLTLLTQLDLSDCIQISELPDGIRNMTALRTLDLSNMKLQKLPDWLPEIVDAFVCSEYRLFPKANKAIVNLIGTTVEDIPDMSIFEQPYGMIVKWFEARKQGRTRPLNEIKVVFLGDGEAGKSHTIARLMNDGGDPDHAIFDGQSTPGIVIRNKEYELGDRKILVHYWDFGGQEIMHSMHRIFLTGRTMYVILLNARDDTQGDRARYWLHNVKSFAPDAPVLLVLNKIDQNENASLDEVDLRSRYDKLTQVVRLSALKYTQEQFNSRFTNALLAEIQNTGFLDAPWPISWTAVKNRLENMESHYIMGDAYQAICQECSVDDNQKNLLHWFNDLGVSFCCCDREDYALEDYVILRPDWITNALYIILFNRLEGAQNGRIPHKTIFELLRTAHGNPNIRCTLPQARYNAGDIQYVLGVMRKFNLSFADGDQNEFIPMLCQQNSTVDVAYYRRDSDVLEFNMDFDYLPNNLLHRLMVERHTELDMANVWRTGARFRLTELGYSAVVVIDGNTLRFFIRHTDPDHRPNTYLTMLKANVDRIVAAMGLKPPTCRLVYKLDGKRDVFDFAMLKAMRQTGQTAAFSMTWMRMIPIADILNQSAPDGLEDERKLLDAIRRSCQRIQAEPDYYQSNEDKRNRRVRDDLCAWGYHVQDQSQRGRSGSGKGVGELDLLLYSEKQEPWTIIEALRVSSGSKTDWNKHLDKLLGNYNYFGARFSYLLTYVDADPGTFSNVWEGYRTHITEYHPDGFTVRGGSFMELNDAGSPDYIKTAKCQYDSGGSPVTVYHIFARIPNE